MFQKNAVYRKTPAGLEALARRDPTLTLRLRSVLILLDGKRGLEEVWRRAGKTWSRSLRSCTSSGWSSGSKTPARRPRWPL